MYAWLTLHRPRPAFGAALRLCAKAYGGMHARLDQRYHQHP